MDLLSVSRRPAQDKYYAIKMIDGDLFSNFVHLAAELLFKCARFQDRPLSQIESWYFVVCKPCLVFGREYGRL